MTIDEWWNSTEFSRMYNVECRTFECPTIADRKNFSPSDSMAASESNYRP
jgi:hypothetical protein